MGVMKVVSAILLCACVLIIHTSTAKHHKQHKSNHQTTHKFTHHDKHHNEKHKHVINDKDRKDKTTKHLDKKSSIPEQKIAKKFDITPHPQKRTDRLTVVMQGRPGKIGQHGPQGDTGSPGPPGSPGQMGGKGLPGVCSRNQCENEQLKSLIQRLLALEKFVNSIENSKKQAQKKQCPNMTMVKVQGLTCAPNLFAIVPLFQLTNGQNAPQSAAGAAQGQPSSGGLSANAKQGQSANAKQGQSPNTNQGQSPNSNQGQSPNSNQGQSPNANQGQSPNANQGQAAPQPTGQSLAKPTQTPTGTAAPTAAVQGPVVIATPPPPPFFVTLQGVTTYDPPMAVLPQTHGAPYLRQPFKTAIPANWISSGKGPINLKPSFARNPPQKLLYSPRWSYKRNKIVHHGLLTHKLATEMLHAKSYKTLAKEYKHFKKVQHTKALKKTIHNDKTKMTKRNRS